MVPVSVERTSSAPASGESRLEKRPCVKLLGEVVTQLDGAASHRRAEGFEGIARHIEEELIPFVEADIERETGFPEPRPANRRTVLSKVNLHLTEAVEFLEESYLPTTE